MMKTIFTNSISARRLAALIAGIPFALAPALSAQLVHDNPNLLAYEGFNYSVGQDLIGQSGGEGWGAPWDVTHSQSVGLDVPIQEGSLSYTDMMGNHLYTTGNFAYAAGGEHDTENTGNLFIARELAAEMSSEAGDVYYISFLAQRAGEPMDPDDPKWDEVEGGYPWGENLYPRNTGVRLLSPPDDSEFGGNDLNALIGTGSAHEERAPLNDWKFVSEDAALHTGELMHTQVHLVVVRIERNVVEAGETTDEGATTGDRATIWVNPVLDVEDEESAMTADVMDGEDAYHIPVGRLGIEAGNSSDTRNKGELYIDEIRVGTTYAAVTPYREGFWHGYEIGARGWVNTGNLMGPLNVDFAPWIYSSRIGWIYEGPIDANGGWIFIAR